MKIAAILVLLTIFGIAAVSAFAGSPESVQSVVQLAVASAKENGTIAGQAVCAEHIKTLGSNVAYDRCLDAVDAQVEPQSRIVVARAYKLAATASDQTVYAFCDDNVDRLTRKGYAACYQYGYDAPRGK